MTTEAERAEELIQQVRGRLAAQRRQCAPEDYVYDKSQDAFWDLHDGTLHKDKAVDASIPQALWRVEVTEPETPRGRRRERLIKPSLDIMRIEADQFVEAATWWPGQPRIVHDWLVGAEGRWPAPGRRLLNTFRPAPEMDGGCAEAGERWAQHVRTLWPEPEEHNYFFDYCAHLLQRPGEKCNAAVVLSGTQGIGKDAALTPVKVAVGAYNTQGIDPNELFSPYRPWLQTLLLVIDEARASKDEYHASAMYNILKPLIAAPPDTLPLNDKFKNMRHIVNCLRVVITTNDRMALFVPEEDRRYFMMHSPLQTGWAPPEYFGGLFAWFDAGGSAHVAAWLRARDLSAFNPKAPPRRTGSWRSVADSWGLGEDDATDGALEALSRPLVVFSSQLTAVQFDGREEMATLVRAPRKLQHRMERCGYVLVPRPEGQERWRAGAGGAWRSRMAFIRDDCGLTSDAARRAEVVKAAAVVAASGDAKLRIVHKSKT